MVMKKQKAKPQASTVGRTRKKPTDKPAAETPLTQSEWLFALEYAKDGNGTAAYQRVKPNCSYQAAAVSANRMLNKDKVREAVAEFRKRMSDRAAVDKSWVLDRLVRNVERSLQAEPVLDSHGHPTGEYQYKPSAVNRGCELIGRELGMFVDAAKQAQSVNVTVMSDDEKRSAFINVLAAMGYPVPATPASRHANGAGLALDRPDADHDDGGDDARSDADGRPLFD